ncbi:MAG: hypothetical protein K2W88_13240 [Pararheinheimera sp.]|nr:hypothetical protein [Rheinheimera sp.]
MSKLISITSFLILLLIFDADASSIQRSFTEFIPNSDLIVYGEVIEIKYFEDNSGFARLNIKGVYKGSVEGRDIVFKWGSSYTEQKLTKVLARHILFLKSDGNDYVAALYGVSVWDVVYVFENPGGSVVRPTPVKDIPQILYTKPGALDCGQGESMSVYFLNDTLPSPASNTVSK